MIVDFDNATKANNDAANSAMADPLPAPISDDIYRPPSKEVIPKNWVHNMHERKLLPTSWPVAAGVTNNAVTSNAPTTFTIVTTAPAVIMAKRRPIPFTGRPCTLAAKGSTMQASKLGPISAIAIKAKIQT